jgi:hypothetical protein
MVVFLPCQAQAMCVAGAADNRIQTYCLVNNAKEQRINIQTAQEIDYRLKREGYERGIGMPGSVSSTSIQTYAGPVLEYNIDINGGNPNKALVLGELTLKGDPSLHRKKGVLFGANLGAIGRHIYGEGRYLDFGYGVNYAHSIIHDIGVAQVFANLCSKNHIHNHWYADACANTNRLKRDITDETTSSVTVSASKLFITGDSNYHQAQVGIRRYYDKNYEQNQISFGLDTIHNNGIFTAFNITFGESVQDTLVTKHSISASIGTTIFDRPIRASYSYSFADGGKLFGVDREDTSQVFSITYTVHPRVNVTFGYRDVDSSIDYFGEGEPIVGVQFAPIRF